mmetsp:Transcript_32320/g.69775  ORF Transcript_32320/g.69775 Transcript_32320/m.69775 type:complete len:170 (-) Transcript_32320:96-605(-)
MEYHEGMWGMRNGKCTGQSFGDAVGSISSTDMRGMYRGGDATGHGGELSSCYAFKKPKDGSTSISSLSDNGGNPLSPTYEERKECDYLCTKAKACEEYAPTQWTKPFVMHRLCRQCMLEGYLSIAWPKSSGTHRLCRQCTYERQGGRWESISMKATKQIFVYLAIQDQV